MEKRKAMYLCWVRVRCGNGPFGMVWCGHQQNDAPVPLGGVKTVSEVASLPAYITSRVLRWRCLNYARAAATAVLFTGYPKPPTGPDTY